MQVQSSKLSTSDFGELQDAATGWDQEYSQMSRGCFAGSLEVVQALSCQVMRERWNQKVQYRGTGLTGCVAAALVLDQTARATWVGEYADMDTVLLQASGKEADLLTGEHWDSLVLAISHEEMAYVTTALAGHEGTTGDFNATVKLSHSAANDLRQNGLALLENAQINLASDKPLLARYLRQFVRLFLWEITNALEHSHAPVDTNRSVEIFRQANDLARSDDTGELGLTEICALLQVSLRTLNYAFLDVCETPPATWLRRLRLNRVYRTLKQAAPEEYSVKRAALDAGFVHQGHFGKQYKQLFGKLPSCTLYAS